MLRNAQLQADQMRSDAERELREVRAQTQRILQEHAEQQARLQAELHTEAVNHAPGVTFFLTGAQVPGRPSMGAWLSYGLGRR